jgi:hypothetical protein
VIALDQTEQPPTEVGGFTRVAEDWKSTHYAPRVENAESSQIAWSSKTRRSRKAEADRLEAGGFNPLMEINKFNDEHPRICGVAQSGNEPENTVHPPFP